MLHPNGIEVFIRPAGSTAADARYEELVLPRKADYEGRYLQCFIPHHVEGFEIVVKYLDGLDMHDASTVLVGIMLRPADATIETPAFVMGFAAQHARNIPGEGVFGAGPNGIPMLESMANDGMRGRGQPKFVLTDDEYAADVRPGCLGIVVQRGNAEWLDESEAKPVRYQQDTFKRSVGPSGQKLFFEFRPLNQIQLQEIRQKLAAPRKKRRPKICRCGDPGHQKPSTKKPFTGPVKIRYPSEQEKPQEKPSGKVCDKCDGFKKPPRGKKLAWRQAFGSWITVPLSAPEEDPPEDELDDEEEAPDNELPRHQYRTPTPLPSHAAFSGIPTPPSERSASGKRQTDEAQPDAVTKKSRPSNERTSKFRLPRDFDPASLPVKEFKPTFLWPGGSDRPLTFEEEIKARRSASKTVATAEDVAPNVDKPAADVQIPRYGPLTDEALWRPGTAVELTDD